MNNCQGICKTLNVSHSQTLNTSYSQKCKHINDLHWRQIQTVLQIVKKITVNGQHSISREVSGSSSSLTQMAGHIIGKR